VRRGARRGKVLAGATALARDLAGGWRTRGCSGFGARLLADFAVGFRS